MISSRSRLLNFDRSKRKWDIHHGHRRWYHLSSRCGVPWCQNMAYHYLYLWWTIFELLNHDRQYTILNSMDTIELHLRLNGFTIIYYSRTHPKDEPPHSTYRPGVQTRPHHVFGTRSAFYPLADPDPESFLHLRNTIIYRRTCKKERKHNFEVFRTVFIIRKLTNSTGLTFLVLGDLSGTSDETSSSGCNETDLLTRRCVTSDSWWITLNYSLMKKFNVLFFIK